MASRSLGYRAGPTMRHTCTDHQSDVIGSGAAALMYNENYMAHKKTKIKVLYKNLISILEVFFSIW